MENLNNLTIMDYVLIGFIGLFLLKKLFTLIGWDRGAMIADDLQDALQGAKSFIAKAREGKVANVDRVLEVAASKIKGVDAEDLRPIVNGLVGVAASDNRYGVNVTLDADGDVHVDPSGLIAKLIRKGGKWFKKIF